jgi:hypothetical protein
MSIPESLMISSVVVGAGVGVGTGGWVGSGATVATAVGGDVRGAGVLVGPGTPSDRPQAVQAEVTNTKVSSRALVLVLRITRFPIL